MLAYLVFIILFKLLATAATNGAGGVGGIFAKWCCLTHPAKCKMLNNVGKISDFAQNMQNFWSEGWRGDTVFLNLSRSYSDRSNIYEACEIISDGYVTCTKYAGGTIWLPEMHIVVLSNFGPIGGKLSEDRLEILTAINGELIKKNAVDLMHSHSVSQKSGLPVTLNIGEPAKKEIVENLEDLF